MHLFIHLEKKNLELIKSTFDIVKNYRSTIVLINLSKTIEIVYESH